MGEDRLIRRSELLKTVGLSRSSVYLMMTRQEFPAAVKISKRAVAWRLSQVSAWMAERQSQSPQKPGLR